MVNCTDPSGDKMLAGPSEDEDDGEGEPTGPHIEGLTAYRHIEELKCGSININALISSNNLFYMHIQIYSRYMHIRIFTYRILRFIVYNRKPFRIVPVHILKPLHYMTRLLPK